jgi:hypothetical protein
MRLVSAPAVWVPMRLVPLVACLGVAVNRQGPCICQHPPPQLEKWRRGAEHVARQLVVESWLAQVTECFLV